MHHTTTQIVVAAMALACAAATAQVDCLKVLELGKLTSTKSDYSVRYSAYYNAFCSMTLSNSTQASERANQFGIPIGELPLTFEGSSRDSDTRNYYSKLCQAIRTDSVSLNDIRQKIETFDDRIYKSFDTCIGQPGVHAWGTSDLGEPGEVQISLRYVRSEVGPSSAKLGGTFGVVPKDAFSECSIEAFKKGQEIQSGQTSSAACIINSKYKARRSVTVTFLVSGLPPKSQQILLPSPVPKRQAQAPEPPAPSAVVAPAPKPKAPWIPA